MRFGVVVFPGSNCDQDIVYMLKDILKQEVETLWHKDTKLHAKYDAIVLPGGFSYGDYLRSGALARLSPIMREVIKFANKGGYVVGICNGFQILCEAGLLPGALLHNDHRKFICKNITLKVQSDKSAFTSGCAKGQLLTVPIAHGEGSYYADKKTIAKMNSKDQILFRYCGPEGELTDEYNPNGSVENIAGVCNEKRNVFGLMPHPERCADENLGNTDGKILFESLISSK